MISGYGLVVQCRASDGQWEQLHPCDTVEVRVSGVDCRLLAADGTPFRVFEGKVYADHLGLKGWLQFTQRAIPEVGEVLHLTFRDAGAQWTAFVRVTDRDEVRGVIRIQSHLDLFAPPVL